MNRTPDVERVLRDYFADDGLAAPDHVLDTLERRIRRQPQRRSWRLPWRNQVSTPYKLAAGLAAVVLIALVGWQLLPGRPGIGAPSPTPNATPVPSASPSQASPSPTSSSSAVFPEWWTSDSPPDGAGILPAGSHATRSFRPGFTFSVPEGFVNDSDSADYFSLFPDTPTNRAEFARSGALAQSIVMGPHKSPYFLCDAWEDNSGATAAEMVDAMLANEALATTGVVDVEIGGLTGKQFDVGVNPDWTEPCPGDPPGSDVRDLQTTGFLLDSADRGVLVIFVGCKRVPDWECRDQTFIVESFEFDLEQ
jgi:hypothetical protein